MPVGFAREVKSIVVLKKTWHASSRGLGFRSGGCGRCYFTRIQICTGHYNYDNCKIL